MERIGECGTSLEGKRAGEKGVLLGGILGRNEERKKDFWLSRRKLGEEGKRKPNKLLLEESITW